MEHSGADAGYLYRLRAGRPECSAAIPSDSPVPEGVNSFVERYVREQIVDDEETMSLLATETAVEGSRDAQSITTQAGVLYPVALASLREGRHVLVAVGILRLMTGSKRPRLELLDTLARLLVQHGDVDAPSAS
jgi:hypothetical protein